MSALNRPEIACSGTRRTRRITRASRVVRLSAVVLLSSAGLVGHLVPGGASDRSRQACAALDLSLVARIEEAGLADLAGGDELLAASAALLEAREACRVGRCAEALEIYAAADRLLTLSVPLD